MNLPNGVLNIYKEKGYTSHDVVALVRKKLNEQYGKGMVKVGHTGTLDPEAQGVLPVCIGRATKLSDYLMTGEKSYRAQLILGITTDTGDHTGQVLKQTDVNCSLSEIREAATSFVGGYMQTPPMYSAIKQQGKKLYELAREGKIVERKPRRVEIPRLDVFQESDEIWLEVDCSKGTYIRSLCEDIGNKLGCGACMGELIRTKSGQFTLDNTIRIGEDMLNSIIPMEQVLPAPRVQVTDKGLKLALNGNTLHLDKVIGAQFNEDKQCWLYHNEVLIGLFVLRKDSLKAQVMMV